MEKKSNSLDKAKEMLAGFGSTIPITAGMITGNPELAISGAFNFFGNILNPIIRGRRDDYINSLYQSIVELQDKTDEFKTENLIKNEQFANAVIKTTEISTRTYQREKFVLLRNAVINSVLKNTVDEDLHSIFLQYVDELSPTHVYVLKNFYDFLNTHPDQRKNIQENVLAKQEFLNELDAIGFIREGSQNIHYSLTDKHFTITFKGIQFLEFVSKPDFLYDHR